MITFAPVFTTPGTLPEWQNPKTEQLGFLKSKSRKTSERDLPKLTTQVQKQAQTISAQANQIAELQSLIARNNQLQSALGQEVAEAKNAKGFNDRNLLYAAGAVAIIATGTLVYVNRKKLFKKAS